MLRYLMHIICTRRAFRMPALVIQYLTIFFGCSSYVRIDTWVLKRSTGSNMDFFPLSFLKFNKRYQRALWYTTNTLASRSTTRKQEYGVSCETLTPVIYVEYFLSLVTSIISLKTKESTSWKDTFLGWQRHLSKFAGLRSLQDLTSLV